MIKVKSVVLKSAITNESHSFTSIASANQHLYSNKEVKFEFGVYWEDGTEQKGRVTGKGVDDWLMRWSNWMLSPAEELTEHERLIRSAQSPGLFLHAKKLRYDLERN